MKGEFYKMDFRAWNLGTVELTLEQEAAYLRLCHSMYDAGGPVPNSTRFLMSIFRCGNAKAVALVNQLVEAGKIAITSDGQLFNHRVSEELANRERVSSARRVAGERGGSASGVARAKPLENKETPEAIASTQRTREEKRREDTPKAPTGAEPEGFVEFCRTYPSRNVRFPTAAARKRWLEAIRKGAVPAEVIAGAKAYAAEQARIGKVGTEFVKTADVWLNQQRWQDYAAAELPLSSQQPNIPDDSWRRHVKIWLDEGHRWMLGRHSPPPDDPQTRIPRHILSEFNIHPAHARAA